MNIRGTAAWAMLVLAVVTSDRRTLGPDANTMFGYGIMRTTTANDAPFYCPMCKGRILSRDSINAIGTVRRLAGATFYCPSCEMFVAPAPEFAINTDSNPDVPC